MEFKYSTSILFSNLGYVTRILLWRLLYVLLVAAIGVAITIPIFNFLLENTEIGTSIAIVENTISSFFNSEISIKVFLENMFTGVVEVMSDIISHTSSLVAIIFSLMGLYAFYTFLNGLLYYPIADIINNLMSSNMRFGFASNLALNFKKAAKFSFCRLIVSFPLDICIMLILIGLGVALYPLLNFFALSIILVIGLVLCVLRTMIFAGWLPRLLFHPKEKMWPALYRSLTFVKHNFKDFFKAYLITYLASYMLLAVFSLPTFGIISLLVPATYYFMLRAVELVGYYKRAGMSFYTDATTVINTIEFGFRDNVKNNDDDDLISDVTDQF